MLKTAFVPSSFRYFARLAIGATFRRSSSGFLRNFGGFLRAKRAPFASSARRFDDSKPRSWRKRPIRARGLRRRVEGVGGVVSARLSFVGLAGGARRGLYWKW